MADPRKKVKQNVAGEFFVDSTCINCDTCRQLAPSVFREDEPDDTSYVSHQPKNARETREALHALLSCPTGSIGTLGGNEAKSAMEDFPLPIDSEEDSEVYYCGFNSPKSYGGNSYFIRHPQGNWLVDSPKYLPGLAKRLEQLGGVSMIFLTHQDDVADADKYAAHFGARRIIHRTELSAQPEAEIVLEGYAPVPFGEDFLVIPTPGHTIGHCALLYRKKYLFTGDHLSASYDEETPNELRASREYTWHSWEERKQSLALLLDYPFEWILPGHGRRTHQPAPALHRELQALLARVS